MNIVIFASGTGTNFINIFNKIEDGFIKGKIVLLISNNPNCEAVHFAIKNKIKTEIINIHRFKNQQKINKQYEKVLDYCKTDLILLAGFMKKIPSNIVYQFKNKIINIHPSLLPKFGGKGFYGAKIHAAVLKSKVKKTGVTIHFVNEKYDDGSIIYQKVVKVLVDDTIESLSKRVLKTEHEIFPKVVKSFCENVTIE